MKNITFKNGIHKIKYQIAMDFIPAHLQGYADIQGVIYVIALIETENTGTAECILEFAIKSLRGDLFENFGDEEIAKEFALKIWDTIYLAFDIDWMIYFVAAAKLNLWSVLNFDKWNYFDFLLNRFKVMDISK